MLSYQTWAVFTVCTSENSHKRYKSHGTALSGHAYWATPTHAIQLSCFNSSSM